LEVVVRDRQTGKTVDGADMNVRRLSDDQWFQSRTNPAGLARLELPPGEYKIDRVFKFYTYATARLSKPINVVKGKTIQVEVRLDPQYKISGIVLDPSEKPLAGTVLHVFPTGIGDVKTGSSGTFNIAWDPIDRQPPFYLIACHPDRNLAAVTEIPRSSQSFKLQLSPAMTVSGRVNDPSGKPIARAVVAFMLHTPYHQGFLFDRTVQTDSAGRFEWIAVPAGQKLILVAKADGFGVQQLLMDTNSAAKKIISLGKITLEPANLSLTGVVLDPRGQPVSGIGVVLFCENQPAVRTVTDTNGKFRFQKLCKGSVRLQADARDKKLWGTVVTYAGDTKTIVKLKPFPTTQPGK